MLTNARRSLERLRLLIDDLIAANQITADKAFVQRTLLDLRTAVTAAAVPLQALIKGKGQLLELDLPVFLPATGDPAALEQVVINLLANAHYHTPPGTQISVAGWCDDDQIHLIVQDDGPGIPADAARVLFEPFHRLGAEAVGSGLGLATARNIIELHSGKLWLEEGTGQGKLFHIALPKTTDTWQNLARV